MTIPEIQGDVFEAIRSLSETVPEMRAGQLIAAVGELCADLHGRGLWEASNEELLEAVWQFRHDLEAAMASSDGHEAWRTERGSGVDCEPK